MAEQIKFELITSKDELNKTLKDAIKNTKGVESSIKGALDVFKGTLAAQAVIGFGNTVVGAFRSAIGVIEDSIDAASEYQVALNSLNVALAQTGQFSEEASQSFRDFADSIEETTTFSDDAVLSSAALIENIGRLGKEDLKRATEASLDLAAALKIDLTSASALVAKASTGNVAALKRYGIEVEKGKTDAETFANALEALESRFKGAAAAASNTFAGAMTQARNAMGNINEELGAAIINTPELIGLIKGIGGVFNDFAKEIKANAPAIREFVADSVNSLLDLANVSISVFAGVGQSVQVLANGFSVVKNVVEIFADAIIGTIVRIAEGYSAILDTIGIGSGDLTKKLREIANSNFSGLEDDVKDLNQAFSGPQGITDAFDNAADSALGITEAIKKSVNQSVSLYAKDKDSFLKAANEKNKGTKSLVESAEDAKKAADEAAAAFKKMGEEASAAFSDPGGTLTKSIISGSSLSNTQGIGLGLGAISQVGQGAQGATNLATQGLGQGAATAFGLPPEVGQQVGQVLQFFAQGAEAVKAQVTAFADQIGELPAMLVEGAVAFAETLLEKIPDIVQHFIESIPRIITAIVEGIPQIASALSAEMPLVAVTFATSLVEQAPKIAEAIAKSIGNAPKNVASGVGGIFKKIGFAEGGQASVKSVPNGFPRDSFPAMLTENELVVDNSTAKKLKDFLDNGTQQQDNRPIVIQIDGREIARAVRGQMKAGFAI